MSVPAYYTPTLQPPVEAMPNRIAIGAESHEWPISRRRPAVLARRGVVASAHTLAAGAGLRALADGGNAFDAAIATALVEGVVLPWACGLGGDMFCVLYQARSEQFFAISGSGCAPHAVHADYFLERGWRTMPVDGLLSVGVPGALDAYATLHEHFGTVPLSRLFEPAIDLAANGFVVSPRLAHHVRTGADRLRGYATSSALFLPGGQPLQIGDVLRRPNLARTLNIVQRGGGRTLYQGELAKAIVSFSEANGGLFSRADFADHRSELHRPLRTSYRGLDIYQPSLPSQGLIMLEMLNILEGFPLGELDPLSAESIHLIAEAKKIAFADRLAYCGDPRFVNSPAQRLLSKQYAAERRAEIDPERAAPPRSDSRDSADETTCCCVVDAQGNAITLIHSLASSWGSGVVAGDTGILLNNRAGRGFTLEEGHPNRLAGGRRTVNTLNCCLLAEEDKPALLWGTPGGDLGLQWNVQVLVHVLDRGLDPQAAIETPRWHSFPGADPGQLDQPPELQLEDRFSHLTLNELRRRGHALRLLHPWGAPSAMQMIMLDHARGTFLGATDPRAEGAALGI